MSYDTSRPNGVQLTDWLYRLLAVAGEGELTHPIQRICPADPYKVFGAC